jgi:DNA-binding Lrp family transcriptional regulator
MSINGNNFGKTGKYYMPSSCIVNKALGEEILTMSRMKDIDAFILLTLLRDGRASFTDIAKSCSVTKSTISKRFKKLEDEGIITGATVQLNFACLGYDALATLLVSVEARQVEQIMLYISKITEIRAYRQYNSKYNIRAVTVLKNLNELDHVKEALRRRLPVIGLKTYIWTDVKNTPENLNLKQAQTNPVVEKEFEETKQRREKAVVDELDLHIIDELSANGRVSFCQLAERLGTSIDTVMKRYQKLKNNDIIKTSIQINPNKIGYHSIMDVNIAIASPSNLSKIVELLEGIPDVIIITKTSGDYDLQLTAMVRDIEQMFTLQDEIARTPGVVKTDSSLRRIPEKWPTPKQYLSTF